ncbi:MAG: metallophosphoesterase family protein [Bdellovibrionales bacterium]
MGTRPSTPTGYRLYAVGDIHGRLDHLVRLLASIEQNAARHPDKKKVVIFLGDYVDRGMDSKGVLDCLSQWKIPDIKSVFLRGNHDDMFLRFLRGQVDVAPSWLSLGGAAALASYGITSLSGVAGKGKIETLLKTVQAKVPQTHVDFLRKTIYAAAYGHYYFVHAGVRPSVPLDQQKPVDQMHIRGDFLLCEDSFGRIVVHGHTIRPDPEVKRNRIGIDTGAFATGKLTCLILDGTSRAFLTT